MTGISILPLLLSLVVIGLLETLRKVVWEARWEKRDISFSASRVLFALRTGGVFAAALLLVTWWQEPLAIVTVTATLWLGALTCETDLRCKRIPREPCWAVFGIALLGNLLQPSWAAVASFVAAFIIVAVTMLFLALVTRGGLGSGDVRFYLAMTPLAWWIGVTPLLFGLLIASVLQAAIRLALLFAPKVPGGRRYLPFGPALFAGALAASVYWTPLVSNPCREWVGLFSC